MGIDLKGEITTAENLILVEELLLKVRKKCDTFLIVRRDTPCELNPHSEASTKILVTSNCQYLLLNVQTALVNGATRSVSLS